MKKIALIALVSFSSLNVFAKEIVVHLPVITKLPGYSINKIVKIEYYLNRINFITRSARTSISLGKDSLSYFAYAYINDYSPPRPMNSFKLQNETTKEEIIKYSELASLSCPFVLNITDYGEIESYVIPDCLSH